ncbi:MAG: hypothetical protein ACAI38_16585 [Myxococcota bacterium]
MTLAANDRLLTFKEALRGRISHAWEREDYAAGTRSDLRSEALRFAKDGILTPSQAEAIRGLSPDRLAFQIRKIREVGGPISDGMFAAINQAGESYYVAINRHR